ncbi:class II glutamine amidotransferase [Sulfurimicrobium lacus]|uniref:Class II glutamine amidotransferase n=1 Tax=Sulfurimicrobium lacus TaxID=2715678 RepID=A0A6F8VG92_9PROT|nr:class II glutamine amidotransferase [Sulfurimicrobium lacus]BCB28127.1 class II glutamine amidotransferase [Sulfurimicrobium lacus]
MCELFGLSANQPITARRELEEFRLRGGLSADNPDGWGLAWQENGGFQLAKEPRPAFSSALLEDLGATLHASLVIAHVRKANFPPVNTLNNTHPFRRECCGREWVFAHNGLVPEIVGMELENRHAVCRPTGETDSEFAFCHLLSHLARDFNSHDADIQISFATLAAASELVASHGKFNFLMSDGEHLIAYGHDRLHYLERTDDIFDSVMIATEPLIPNADWISFELGELRIYRRGKLTLQLDPLNFPATKRRLDDMRQEPG